MERRKYCIFYSFVQAEILTISLGQTRLRLQPCGSGQARPVQASNDGFFVILLFLNYSADDHKTQYKPEVKSLIWLPKNKILEKIIRK